MFKLAHRPIQVYLDSSDFSNMSISNRTPEADGIRRFLIEKVHCGKIEIRFSAVHLMEAAARDQQYLSNSRERFSFIRELCGDRCFIDPFSLMTDEAQGKATTKAEGYPSRDDGIWLPSIEDIKHDIPDLKATLLEELDRAPINRSQRRHLTRKLIGKDGTLSTQALQMLNARPEALLSNLSKKYPLNNEGIGIVLDALTGKIPRSKIDEQFRNLLANISRFHEWHEKSWKEISPMMDWLRQHGRRLEQLIIAQHQVFEGLRGRAAAAGLDRATVLELESKARSRLQLAIPKAIRRGVVGEPDGICHTGPSLDLFCAVLTIVAMNTVFSGGNPRKPRSSDFGDALHAVYLPYVDVFRADSYMSSVLHGINETGNAIIVSKLAQLPKAICQAIAAR